MKMSEKTKTIIYQIIGLAILVWMCWVYATLPPETIEIVELWGY